MDRKKVTLPREVAEALEKERGALPDNAYILWKSSRDDAKERKYFSILHEFVNQKDNIFKLADALRYGYEVEPEPITVTITPEMQKQIRTWYEGHQEDADSHFRIGFVTALGLCNIKISGVNE
jgi:hypothetical protein